MVLEVVLFKVKTGVNEVELIQALHESQEVLREASGFISRETFKNQDGQWHTLATACRDDR